MIFNGIHGCYPDEKKYPQRYRVDITLDVSVPNAVTEDTMSATVNWADIYDITKNIIENHSYNLIETLCDVLANAILKTDARINCVHIEIAKPDIWKGNGYPSVVFDKCKEE